MHVFRADLLVLDNKLLCSCLGKTEDCFLLSVLLISLVFSSSSLLSPYICMRADVHVSVGTCVNVYMCLCVHVYECVHVCSPTSFIRVASRNMSILPLKKNQCLFFFQQSLSTWSSEREGTLWVPPSPMIGCWRAQYCSGIMQLVTAAVSSRV